MIDILYWIFGVAILSIAINMVLETLEKANYKAVVNVTAFAIILLRVIPLIADLFRTAEVFLRW